HQGILYPRWADGANFGFGEPRFIFYPPASWMLGAVLGLILPWRMVPDAFIWLALFLSGAGTYRLARTWLRPGDAAAAAVFVAVNPYHLVIVFYRSDFAELLASALFPLLFLQTLALVRERWRRVPGFALIYAVIWLSNAPAAVIATYSVAVIVLLESFRLRSIKLLATAAAGGAAGLALAAFYVLPAAIEQRWVNISQALSAELQPWQNFLFTRAEDPEFVLFNWKVSGVAMIVIGLFGIAAVFSARRRKSAPEIFWPFYALGIVAVVLMFPVTVQIWRDFPELKFVQFPWRWLVPLDVIAMLFLCAAIAPLRRRWIAWGATALVLAALGAWMTTN